MYRMSLSVILLSSFAAHSYALDPIVFLTPSASGGQASQTTNSTRLETDNKLYQAQYNMTDLSGRLLEYTIQASGATVSTASSAESSFPAPGARKLITIGDGNTGIDFTAAAIASTAHYSVVSGAMLSGPIPNLSDLISYLAGDESHSVASYAARSRTTPLGDIINSSPQFAGNFNYGYEVLTTASVSGSTLPANDSPGDRYASYIRSGASATRDSLIYVGANDGAFHAFNADGLEEVFAYYPRSGWERVASLASTSYDVTKHQYYVDGSAQVADVYDPSPEAWKTAVVGSMGAGGSGVFALDVTDPVTSVSSAAASFAADTVLWEVNHTDTGFEELGYSLPQPSVVLLENGQWAAVVANGYGSASGDARLFLVDLFSGAKIKEFNLGGIGTNNGLSTPIAVDTNGDMAADLVYAGDLDGNLWRFDLSNIDPSLWTSSILFVATDGSARQPIIAKPQVVSTSAGQVVLFGTGKYFESGDEASIATRSSGLTAVPAFNSFYGIQDRNGGTTVADNKLVVQTLDYEGTTLGTACNANSPCVRVTSANDLTTAQRGWRLSFPATAGYSNETFMERIVSEPVVRNGRVIFTTLIPDGAPYSGTGWIMELSAQDGKRLDRLPFDLDQNGVFDALDKMADNPDTQGENVANAIISGVQSTVGLISTPNVIAAGSKEYKFNSGSSADIQVTVESGGGVTGKGRTSWQQLR